MNWPDVVQGDASSIAADAAYRNRTNRLFGTANCESDAVTARTAAKALCNRPASIAWVRGTWGRVDRRRVDRRRVRWGELIGVPSATCEFRCFRNEPGTERFFFVFASDLAGFANRSVGRFGEVDVCQTARKPTFGEHTSITIRECQRIIEQAIFAGEMNRQTGDRMTLNDRDETFLFLDRLNDLVE